MYLINNSILLYYYLCIRVCVATVKMYVVHGR